MNQNKKEANWYEIENGKVIFGHNTKTKQEIVMEIDLDELINEWIERSDLIDFIREHWYNLD